MGYLKPREHFGAPPAFPPAPRPGPHACDVHPILWFADARAKPLWFPDLVALSKALVRRSDGAPIDGEGQFIGLAGSLHKRKVVSVWSVAEAGGRNEFLGYVWLGGRDKGHATLKAALQALELSGWAP